MVILFEKKIMKKLAILVISGIMLASCSEWLVEKPKRIAESVFYNTPSEVETAVNAILLPLRQAREAQFANYIATLECQSDWMVGRGSWEPLSQYQGLNDVNTTRVQGFWNAFYVGIRNANLVILNAPNGTSISQQDIAKYVGEAKFLRAFLYYQLVQNWGSVPLRTEANMIQRDLPKSSVDDIYDLIVSDLLDAETNLPPTPSVKGRPTRWAAKTLLADVFLNLNRPAEAAARANEVIQQGGFSLVPVSSVEDIQTKIFGPDDAVTNAQNEEIFALKYARIDNQGNYILWISLHPSMNLYINGGGAYAVHGDASNPNYINWNDDDIRKGMWSRINYGNAPNALISSKYADPQAVSQYGAGNDQPIFRYPDALLLYAEAAARAENTVSAAAMEALNKVHRRAYGYDPETPSPVDLDVADYTVETFIDRVIQERGYEFIYEGKRWLELKRTGKVHELVQYGKGRPIAEKHLLWPIPASEMNFNNALDPTRDQNPGY